MMNTILRNTVIAAFNSTIALQVQSATTAQVEQTKHILSLQAAMTAANEAIMICTGKGWPISVSIVDAAGNLKLQAKGDGSAPHTADASFRKAYTTVAYSPLFHFDRLSEWIEALRGNPLAPSYATLPNIFLLPGAVTIKDGNDIIGAIGVGGAPGGDNDEICAEAGWKKIKDHIAK